MNCDKCGREAIVELNIIDGEHHKILRFCDQHYIEFLEENEEFLIQNQVDFMKSFIEDLVSSMTSGFSKPEYKNMKCSSCGTSLDWVFKYGKFGCDQCFTDFSVEMDELVKKTQGSFSYEGKFPHRYKDIKEKIDQIKELNAKLNIAIKEERYEDAAVLRDLILEKEDQKEGIYE